MMAANNLVRFSGDFQKPSPGVDFMPTGSIPGPKFAPAPAPAAAPAPAFAAPPQNAANSSPAGFAEAKQQMLNQPVVVEAAPVSGLAVTITPDSGAQDHAQPVGGQGDRLRPADESGHGRGGHQPPRRERPCSWHRRPTRASA